MHACRHQILVSKSHAASYLAATTPRSHLLLLELLLEEIPWKSGKAHFKSHRKATSHISFLLSLDAFQADR